MMMTAPVHAAEFSADLTYIQKKAVSKGRLFYAPDRCRIELHSPGELVLIMRVDRKVIWSVIPAKKLYVEMPMGPDKRLLLSEKIEGELERKNMGHEPVNGYQATKFLVRFLSGRKEKEFFQWWSSELGVPVKTAAVDGAWEQEYTGISVGPQPAGLFELPMGYRKKGLFW